MDLYHNHLCYIAQLTKLGNLKSKYSFIKYEFLHTLHIIIITESKVVLPIPVICCLGMTTSPCLDIGSFKSFIEDDITSPNITKRPNSLV